MATGALACTTLPSATASTSIPAKFPCSASQVRNPSANRRPPSRVVWLRRISTSSSPNRADSIHSTSRPSPAVTQYPAWWVP